ncbi:MAG: hypothetical protein AAF485_19985, partial [Chloroflexota bacterium]
MSSRSLRILLFSLLFILLILALFISSGPATSLWLKAPGWSRARLIADAPLNQPAPVVVDEQGQLYLFLFQEMGQAISPQLMAFNRDLEVLWSQTVDHQVSEPTGAQVLWHGETIHLFWLDEMQLYSAQLGRDGEIKQSPYLLSGATAINSYTAALGPDGTPHIWYSGSASTPGIYQIVADELNSEPTVVDPLGVNAQIRIDQAGNIHTVWVTDPTSNTPTLHYNTSPAKEFNQSGSTPIITLSLRADTTFEGPWLGLDQQQVYLIWAEFPNSGRSAGQRTVNYTHFPQQDPANKSGPEVIQAPYTRRLKYEAPINNGLETGLRVSLDQLAGRRVSPSELAINPANEAEFVLAMRVRAEHLEDKEASQIGVAFFQAGQKMGYQPLSFTPGPSAKPTVISDGAQQLYLTWLEAREGGGFHIYLASTASDIIAFLRPLSLEDIAR